MPPSQSHVKFKEPMLKMQASSRLSISTIEFCEEWPMEQAGVSARGVTRWFQLHTICPQIYFITKIDWPLAVGVLKVPGHWKEVDRAFQGAGIPVNSWQVLAKQSKLPPCKCSAGCVSKNLIRCQDCPKSKKESRQSRKSYEEDFSQQKHLFILRWQIMYFPCWWQTINPCNLFTFSIQARCHLSCKNLNHKNLGENFFFFNQRAS